MRSLEAMPAKAPVVGGSRLKKEGLAGGITPTEQNQKMAGFVYPLQGAGAAQAGCQAVGEKWLFSGFYGFNVVSLVAHGSSISFAVFSVVFSEFCLFLTLPPAQSPPGR